MNDLLTTFGAIATVFWLITLIHPDFLPKNLKEIIESLKNGTVKAWRILHPFLLLIWYYEPQIWWKVLIMIITIELSIHFVTSIVNWSYRKLGF